MTARAQLPYLAAVLVALSAGCISRDEPVAERGAATSPPASEGEANAASPPTPEGAVQQAMVRVRGTVRLADGSELPVFTGEQIGRQPDRPGVPDGCSPARVSDTSPMRLSEQRGVGGVLVTATGNPDQFRQLPSTEPRTIAVSIRDCRLTPSLVVAAVGDVIELTNRSPVAFITTYTTHPINEAQAPERSRRIEIVRAGVQRVECTMGAGCGRTDVVVLAHRVATVTDAEGRFELDVPAGTEITLHAWHPLMGRREGEARLTIDQAVAGETRTLDIPLTLVPIPEPQPAPQTPAIPGAELH